MKNRVNWLAIVAIAILLMPGVIASAKAAGVTYVNIGIVIGGEKSMASVSRSTARYTCGAAKVKVTLAGYKNVEALDCSGNIYTFTVHSGAGSSPGERGNVGFDALSGHILKM